jgi:hypothetical protein
VAWVAEVPRSFESGLDALAASCAADAACGAAFGDLKAKFIAGVYDLATSPLPFDHPDGAFDFDGGWYASTVFSALYARSTYPWLPLLISDLAERRSDRVAEFLIAFLEAQAGRDGVSSGLYSAIVCGEQFNPPDSGAARGRRGRGRSGHPRHLRRGLGGPPRTRARGSTSTPRGRPCRCRVTSSVPTLVDSGAMDPITPPTFADIAAATLSDRTVVTVPNSGHGALLQSPCGHAILGAFFADPTAALDTTCAVAVTTDYVVPDALAGDGLGRGHPARRDAPGARVRPAAPPALKPPCLPSRPAAAPPEHRGQQACADEPGRGVIAGPGGCCNSRRWPRPRRSARPCRHRCRRRRPRRRRGRSRPRRACRARRRAASRRP